MPLEITLRPELGQFVEEKVRSGDFASPSEVIGLALAFFKEQEDFIFDESPELREQIAIGEKQIAEGKCGPWDGVALRAKITERLNDDRKNA